MHTDFIFAYDTLSHRLRGYQEFTVIAYSNTLRLTAIARGPNPKEVDLPVTKLWELYKKNYGDARVHAYICGMLGV